ncbi:hypothetical protein Tco_0231613, partial [Tanacetum coccineum]
MGSIDLSSVSLAGVISNFDYVHSDSLVSLDGSWCIWDPNLFRGVAVRDQTILSMSGMITVLFLSILSLRWNRVVFDKLVSCLSIPRSNSEVRSILKEELRSLVMRLLIREIARKCGFSKTYGDSQQDFIRISKEEVKRAVWDCGVDKSLGPDGFSFSFYRHFWPVIEKDGFKAVDYFF